MLCFSTAIIAVTCSHTFFAAVEKRFSVILHCTNHVTSCIFQTVCKSACGISTLLSAYARTLIIAIWGILVLYMCMLPQYYIPLVM